MRVTVFELFLIIICALKAIITGNQPNNRLDSTERCNRNCLLNLLAKRWIKQNMTTRQFHTMNFTLRVQNKLIVQMHFKVHKRRLNEEWTTKKRKKIHIHTTHWTTAQRAKRMNRKYENIIKRTENRNVKREENIIKYIHMFTETLVDAECSTEKWK